MAGPRVPPEAGRSGTKHARGGARRGSLGRGGRAPGVGAGGGPEVAVHHGQALPSPGARAPGARAPGPSADGCGGPAASKSPHLQARAGDRPGPRACLQSRTAGRWNPGSRAWMLPDPASDLQAVSGAGAGRSARASCPPCAAQSGVTLKLCLFPGTCGARRGPKEQVHPLALQRGGLRGRGRV